MNMLETVLISLATAAIGAIVGTYGGVYFINKKNEEKNENLRNLGASALQLFLKYAKDNNTFDIAKNDFNNNLNTSEKRAIVVLLHKLGIPISVHRDGCFDIKNVDFLHEKINKSAIIDMIDQINSGRCDNLFYLDPETHFGDEILIKKKREIALRYINKILIDTKINKDKQFIEYKKYSDEIFSPGECSVIKVFQRKNQHSWYYNEECKIDTLKIETLKKELDIGLWDDYLKWDGDSYENIQSQRRLADTLTNAIEQTGQIFGARNEAANEEHLENKTGGTIETSQSNEK